MSGSDRFRKIYSQGTLSTIEIWEDTVTGINYLYRQSGYSGGLTPLLDRDGRPVVSQSPYYGDRNDFRR